MKGKLLAVFMAVLILTIGCFGCINQSSAQPQDVAQHGQGYIPEDLDKWVAGPAVVLTCEVKNYGYSAKHEYIIPP